MGEHTLLVDQRQEVRASRTPRPFGATARSLARATRGRRRRVGLGAASGRPFPNAGRTPRHTRPGTTGLLAFRRSSRSRCSRSTRLRSGGRTGRLGATRTATAVLGWPLPCVPVLAMLRDARATAPPRGAAQPPTNTGYAEGDERLVKTMSGERASADGTTLALAWSNSAPDPLVVWARERVPMLGR
jgi:hypothetical protein